jgi:hypothetical protein
VLRPGRALSVSFSLFPPSSPFQLARRRSPQAGSDCLRETYTKVASLGLWSGPFDERLCQLQKNLAVAGSQVMGRHIPRRKESRGELRWVPRKRRDGTRKDVSCLRVVLIFVGGKLPARRSWRTRPRGPSVLARVHFDQPRLTQKIPQCCHRLECRRPLPCSEAMRKMPSGCMYRPRGS